MLSHHSKRMASRRSVLYSSLGVPLTSFDPDPYWSNVKLLLQGDYLGSNVIIKDNSSRQLNPQPVGDAQLSSTQTKFGSHSMYFDGTGDHMMTAPSTAFAVGTGDFTVELWCYPTNAANTQQTLLSFKGTDGFRIFCWSSLLRVYAGGTSKINAGTIASGAWTHIALVRIAGVLTGYVNGAAVAAGVSSTENYSAECSIYVGGYDGNYTGYIDDVRVTVGTGRYPGNFTAPAEPFQFIEPGAADQHWTSTSLLVHADAANNQTNAVILDSSASAHTVTRNGDVAQGTFSPFPVAAGLEYSPTVNGGSAYFDGTGDYLTVASHADFAIGTGDFTVEFFVYRTASDAYDGLFDVGTYTSGMMIRLENSNLGMYINSTNVLTVAAPASNAWSHIAFVRVSGSLRLYYNGVQRGSNVANSADIPQGAITIGSSAHDVAGSYFTGFLGNINFIKGTAKYTGAFTAPSVPVEAHANTKLLLNFTNAAIRDETGKHILKIAGDTKTMVAINKYGGSSMYFDGTGDYVLGDGSTDFAFGTGDFTVEMWVYKGSNGNQHSLFDHRAGTANGAMIYLFITTGEKAALYVYGVTRITGTISVPLNGWCHVALSRASSVTRLFVDGILDGSWADTTNYTVEAARPAIGTNGNSVATNLFLGYLDDVRVTKGYGRYTGNFVPPALAFPNK